MNQPFKGSPKNLGLDNKISREIHRIIFRIESTKVNNGLMLFTGIAFKSNLRSLMELHKKNQQFISKSLSFIKHPEEQ